MDGFCAGEQRRLQAAGAHVGRSCAALSGPSADGEKGIGKLRVWAKNGLGGLRIGRAIGAALCLLSETPLISFRLNLVFLMIRKRNTARQSSYRKDKVWLL